MMSYGELKTSRLVNFAFMMSCMCEVTENLPCVLKIFGRKLNGKYTVY